MANQFLGLSLFVMLLSFFIILNSLSNFEEIKSRPVMNSIAIAFSKRVVDQSISPNYEEDLTQDSYREGDTLDQLEALFRSQITGVDLEKNRLGTVMHIRVPLEKFEREIMEQTPGAENSLLKGAGGDFGPALVSILDASQSKIPYRIDIILNLEKNPATLENENQQAMNMDIKKAAFFAQRIEAMGLPKKYITSGLGKGDPGMVDLFFRRYIPFNPLGDQSKSPGRAS